jgi:hypothetical protein
MKLIDTLIEFKKWQISKCKKLLRPGEEFKRYECGYEYPDDARCKIEQQACWEHKNPKPPHSKCYHLWLCEEYDLACLYQLQHRWNQAWMEQFHIEALEEDEERDKIAREAQRLADAQSRKQEYQERQPRSERLGWGIIYLIRASQLGVFGCRGYVGQEQGLNYRRPKEHLRGSDPCTDFLVREMQIKGVQPTFDVFGPYPANELDIRERQHYIALQEAGWSLCNRKQLN